MLRVKAILIDGIEQLRGMACDLRAGRDIDAAQVDRLADELVGCLREAYRIRLDQAEVDSDKPEAA